jgi:photosystem II stability/assembly factor-like uncharacterized protein
MRKAGVVVALCLAASVGSAADKPRKAAASPAPPPPAGLRLGKTQLGAIKARSIGPAVMSGRVSEIALDPQDPFTFYVALGTGGLFKTANDGSTFTSLFDKEAVASVGAVAVAPSDPRVVWVGSGEGNDRNSSSWGNGVYRSTDGGESWTNVGLPTSRFIGRIVVHPTDPATAWVAVLGDLWNATRERGLYKTTDAGQTWTKVLAAAAPYDDRVGSGDVAIDPQDPSVLYATLYARRRTPWSFTYGPGYTDGKDLGGIFKSTDGGAIWRKLEKGLPGASGNIGLSVFRKDPRIVYAIVQSDAGGQSSIDQVRSRAGGVFRSDDAGETWTRTSPLNPRPFYFSQIRVDPENDQRVWVLGYALHVSHDGGRSFHEDRFGKVHPDCHALAIDPRHPKRMLLGTDGGPYLSRDEGKTWEHLNRFAAGEFYRINVDMSSPYRICGGLQDNVNWVGPSETYSKEGILNSDWINIGGGDGFYCVFDAENPNLVYSESQSGYVFRFDLASGQAKELRPEPSEGQAAYRFHWNSPLLGSRHEKGALYLAGNRVFKLTGKGERFQPISPDLSAQDPARTTAVGSGAETYAIVYALAESPLQAGLLWAGTDDGKLWVTENGGGQWSDLSAGLPAAARGQWIMRVEASHHDARVAYLAVDAHRSGDYAPLLYRTADLGRTWSSVAGDLPAGGPVKVVREDPKRPDLLFAGTEFGLFASLDRGARWTPLGGLPTVAVDDILIHPRDRDLVAATHGRSLYVIDDIGALAELTPEVAAREAHLFTPAPALARHLLPGFGDWNGGAIYRGENPPAGATFTYWVREATGEPVKIRITDARDQAVAKLEAPGLPGLGRVTWDLKPAKDVLTEYGGEGALFVRPGTYTVTLAYGPARSEQKFEVKVMEGVETR